MSFNEFLRDHYKAALGAVRSHTWPRSHTTRASRVCETQHGAVCHDDPTLFISLSLTRAHAPLLPHVYARPYYIPRAFSQIELYRLENWQMEPTRVTMLIRGEKLFRNIERCDTPFWVANCVSLRLALPMSVPWLLSSNKTVGGPPG